MPNSTLEVTVRKTKARIVVEVIGEVDLMTVEALGKSLDEAAKAVIEMEQALPLSVDLRLVDFIDGAGLALLIETRKRLAQAGRSLQVLLTQGQQPDRVLSTGRFGAIMALTYDGD